VIRFEELHEIVSILQQGLATDEAYEAVFRLLEKTIEFESATLFLYDADEDRLEIGHQVGKDVVDLVTDIDFSRGAGMASWVSQRTEPIILANLGKSRPGKDNRFHSFVSLPLRAAGKLIGVLNLGHSRENVYERSDQDVFAALAAEVSIVVDIFQMRRQLESQNRELTAALDQLQQAQQQLVENERMAAIGELIVTVNHEINNPLTSIIGLVEILELSYATASPEKVQESFRAILRESRRIQRITEKLRDLKTAESAEYVGQMRMTKLPEG